MTAKLHDGMIAGAFAFLDCLGFKGIWNRRNPEVQPRQLIEFFMRAEATVKGSPTFVAIQMYVPNVAITPIFISDTVAISVHCREAPRIPHLANGYLVSIAAQMSVELCKLFAKAPVPLLFRGVIVFGSYLAEGQFLLGPAVDEAATLAETAQAAIVWLAPEAQHLHRAQAAFERENSVLALQRMACEIALERVEKYATLQRQYIGDSYMPEETDRNLRWWAGLDQLTRLAIAPHVLCELAKSATGLHVIRDYPVEMKGGGVLVTDVVNPFFGVALDRHAPITETLLSTFVGSTVDVMLKRQNTARFLAIASARTRDDVVSGADRLVESRARLTELSGIPFPAK